MQDYFWKRNTSDDEANSSTTCQQITLRFPYSIFTSPVDREEENKSDEEKPTNLLPGEFEVNNQVFTELNEVQELSKPTTGK